MAKISPRELIQQALAAKEEQAKRELALESFPIFCSEFCGLNIEDVGDGNPFFDFTPGSPYVLMYDFLMNPNGKHKFLVAGRRTGKTYFVQGLTAWKMILNPKFRLFIGSENQKTAIDRSVWIRGVMERLDGKFGKIVTRQWAKDSWTRHHDGGAGHPSCTTAGPRQGKTGGHPDLFWLDDVVGEEAFESEKLQEEGVSWFKNKLIFQRGHKHGTFWITGTMWPGAIHLYREILKIEFGKSRPKFTPVGDGAKLHEGKVFDILSFGSGWKQRKAIFKCLPLEFLDEQFAMNETMARCQYDNELLDFDEIEFQEGWAQYGEPPGEWANGKFKPAESLRYYACGDWATSTRDSKSSMSCWVIFAKNAEGKVWLLKAKAGRLHPDVVSESFISGLIEAEREYECNVEHICMENTGPGVMYPNLFVHAAEKAGKSKMWIEAKIRPIPRRTDTHHRIMAWLHGPCSKMKLFFMRDNEEFFQILPDGAVTGLAGDEWMSYSYESNIKPDILDAFSDIWAKDRTGTALYPAPETPEKRELPEMNSEKWFAYYNKKLASRRVRYIE